MKGFKKKIREDTLKRIDEELPEVEGIDQAKRRPRVPIFALVAAPILAAGLVLAIALPLALRQPLEPSPSQPRISQSTEQSTQFTPNQNASEVGPISVNEAQAIANLIGIGDMGQADGSITPTFKRVLEGKANLLHTLEGYDESVERKIAITVPQERLDIERLYQEHGNNIDGFHFDYGNGVVWYPDTLYSAYVYSYSIAETIPVAIENRPVVAVYYEGTYEILDELCDDVPELCGTQKSYYLVRCEAQKDGTILEKPSFVKTEHLRYYENPTGKFPSTLPLRFLTNITTLPEGKINCGRTAPMGFFAYESVDRCAPFHIPEIDACIEASETMDYASLKEIANQYKAYYREETAFVANWKCIDLEAKGKKLINYFRTFFSPEEVVYAATFDSCMPEEEVAAYDEVFFQTHRLAVFTLSTERAEVRNITLNRSYRKGDDIHVELNMECDWIDYAQLPFNKVVLIEIPVGEMIYPNSKVLLEAQKVAYEPME